MFNNALLLKVLTKVFFCLRVPVPLDGLSWWTVCSISKHCTHSSPLQWRHNELDGVSNHRRLHCSHTILYRRRSKKTSKFRVTGLCEGNSSVTGEFPAQRAGNAEKFSIWWRLHDSVLSLLWFGTERIILYSRLIHGPQCMWSNSECYG